MWQSKDWLIDVDQGVVEYCQVFLQPTITLIDL